MCRARLRACSRAATASNPASTVNWTTSCASPRRRRPPSRRHRRLTLMISPPACHRRQCYAAPCGGLNFWPRGTLPSWVRPDDERRGCAARQGDGRARGGVVVAVSAAWGGRPRRPSSRPRASIEISTFSPTSTPPASSAAFRTSPYSRRSRRPWRRSPRARCPGILPVPANSTSRANLAFTPWQVEVPDSR